MPLLKCHTCEKDVADTAEVCPHCGQDLPQKDFRKGEASVICPKCPVWNYRDSKGNWDNLGQRICRSCGTALEEVIAKSHKKDFAKKLPKRFAFAGVVLGFFIGLALSSRWAPNGAFLVVILGILVGGGVAHYLGEIAEQVYKSRNRLHFGQHDISPKNKSAKK
jgi:ssDNA-binding Zn-finger/Zn-ribbon topoisomerase 1